MIRWKTIEGYDGIFSVSELGLVKRGDVELTQQTNNAGYKYVDFWLYNKKKRFLVHRLVAIAFIPNPKWKKQVNHKNGIRDDNKLENLEWCTNGENAKHSYDNLGRKGVWLGKNGQNNFKYKKIECLTNGVIYEGITIAAKELGLKISKICLVCCGKRNYTGGYKFKYAA